MNANEKPMNREQLRDAIRDMRPDGVRPAPLTINRLIAQGLPTRLDYSYPIPKLCFFWSEVQPWLYRDELVKAHNPATMARKAAMAAAS
jgi:hypothetical protein